MAAAGYSVQAIALNPSLTVVRADAEDFSSTGAGVLNPWTAPDRRDVRGNPYPVAEFREFARTT